MEALVIATQRIILGDGKIYLAGGVESMTHVPIMFNEKMRDIFMGLSKAKTLGQKLKHLLKIRPSGFAPVVPSISDPLCSLTMGQTAEILANEFHITREEQDRYAYESQKRAAEATASGFFSEEIVPVPNYATGKMQTTDDGIRADTNLEGLAKLPPVFNKGAGTVTAATSSQVTDGSCMLVLMDPDEAKRRGIRPLGYISAYSSVGVDPSRMGIGPAYAIPKVLKRAGLKLKDIDLVEINEAFAAQVLAVRAALASPEYCQKNFGLSEPVGLIDLDKLNVNGGAVALGHPLGASGARIVLTLLRELRRRKLQRGLAALCVGGGQGEAVILEVE
jgi:acetyl-CoA acyltransferase